jgi:hypothetical protein
MNIDGYLHRFKAGLARFEELVRKICDLADNRVEGNLAGIRATLLVDLPADRSFTYDEFISAQVCCWYSTASCVSVLYCRLLLQHRQHFGLRSNSHGWWAALSC